MNSFKLAVTWFAFGAVIGVALMMQPIIAPILPKDPGDRLVYVFKRSLAFAGGSASAIELSETRDGLVIENLSFAKDLDGREIGFSVDRIHLEKVDTERVVDLYLGRTPETEVDYTDTGVFADVLSLEGIDLRTGQDFVNIKSVRLTEVGTDNYRSWLDPETFGDGGYASVLAFLVLTGTAQSVTADEVFFRNESTVPISATIDVLDAKDVSAGQVGRMTVENVVAQWRIGNGVTMESATIKTFNAREIVSAAAGQDNDLDAPEALIFDIAEFSEFSVHTPDIEIVRIPSGTVATYTQLGQIPVSARLELQDLSLDVDAIESESARAYLRDAGIGEISVDASLAYIFDRNSGLLTIKDGAITAPDLARVDIDAEFSGIRPSWDAISDFISGLQQSQIVGAQARFEDRSIVARFSEKWARDTNKQPEDFIHLFTTPENDGVKAGRVEAAASVLKDFLSTEEALTINVAPDEPVPVEFLLSRTSPQVFLETLAVDLAIEVTASGQILPD